MISAAALAQLKRAMETEIAALEVKIAELTELVKPVAPDSALGRISRMDTIRHQSMNEATMTAAKNKLTQLQAALARTTDPHFGLCQRCDQAIPLKRLELMPESTLCVACAEKAN